MHKSSRNTLHIFFAFMWRDAFVYCKDISTHVINYVILYPLMLGFCFAYLQKNIYFGVDAVEKGTTLFLGSITMPLLSLTFKVIVELLFDIEGNRYIDYQISLINPRLLVLQRIFFASLYTFIMTLPFVPMVKLIVGNHLATTNASWPTFALLMYVSSLCCASYTMLAICLLSVNTIGAFWVRVTWVLMNIGGFWVPLAIIKQYSSVLGFLAYFDPLMYMMEGTRGAILGSENYLPASLCICALLFFSVCFTLLSLHFFKKRIDHI